MGTQSLVFQAPLDAEPVTWPILSDVVLSPFCEACERSYDDHETQFGHNLRDQPTCSVMYLDAE
jgi:hypothetical protein